MDLKIDDIVKQVLSEVGTHKENRTAFTLERMPVLTGNETGRSAVLVSPESYELKEYKPAGDRRKKRFSWKWKAVVCHLPIR